jgi:hypothetical protein
MSILTERELLYNSMREKYHTHCRPCPSFCTCCNSLIPCKDIRVKLLRALQVNSKIKLTERELFTLRFQFPSLIRFIKENL